MTIRNPLTMTSGVKWNEDCTDPGSDVALFAFRLQIKSDIGNYSYGFQWWIHTGGAYEASGVFGQSNYINPTEKLVIVTHSAWTQADGLEPNTIRNAFVDAVVKAVYWQSIQQLTAAARFRATDQPGGIIFIRHARSDS